MKNISIPNTDLTLSAIGLGTVNAGIAWDHADAYRIFDSFLGAGGSLIDTAHVYSDWIPGETARAERVVGEWIKSRGGKHDDFVLMTKGGHPRQETMEVSRMSRDDMEGDLDSSLLQLGVDCVDIYFYHRDDPNQTVDELIEVMEAFRRAGKIRYYACSNWTTARMQAADQYCRAHGYRGFVANQDLYNMGVAHMLPYPDPTMVVCDGEMLEYHKHTDNLLMPYMGVCSGFFHKLQKKGLDAVAGSCYNTPENLEIAKGLDELCARRGLTITQALLGFFQVQDVPMVPLASASNLAQLAELEKALQTEFSPADYDFLQA